MRTPSLSTIITHQNLSLLDRTREGHSLERSGQVLSVISIRLIYSLSPVFGLIVILILPILSDTGRRWSLELNNLYEIIKAGLLQMSRILRTVLGIKVYWNKSVRNKTWHKWRDAIILWLNRTGCKVLVSQTKLVFDFLNCISWNITEFSRSSNTCTSF